MFDESPKPKPIVVDLKRLRMREIAKFTEMQNAGNSGNDMAQLALMVPLMARICNLTEEEVWDWDFETMMVVQEQINTAMADVLKKTKGGS